MSSYEFRDIALILAEVSQLETSSQSRSQESISVMGRESVSSVVKFFWIGDHDEYEKFYS